MIRRVLRLAAWTLFVGSSGAVAVGLMDAYQAARQNDPTFRAARYERDAGQYAIAIGRSGLLPTLAATGSYSKNNGERESTTVDLTQPLDYNDTVSSITLRQPLFNYDSFVRYQQGGVQAAHSDAIFDRKEAELAVKVSAAYFEILLATEKLALTDAEMAAYRAQRELAERRRKSGEGTVTEVAEAESRLQLARAGRADALDSLAVATLRLEKMTGKPVQPLWILRPEFTTLAVQPAHFEEWSVLAQDNSPEIRARRKAWEFSSLDVDRNRAGHYPQLDFVARSTRSENETISTLNQKSSINTVGVQVNIPTVCGRPGIGTHRSGGGQPRAGAGRTRCRHRRGHDRGQTAIHGRPDR
jgi:protease secretion system outer membrane protein